MQIGSFSDIFYNKIKIERDLLIDEIDKGKAGNPAVALEHIQALCSFAKDLFPHGHVNNPQQLKSRLLKSLELIEEKTIRQQHNNGNRLNKALWELKDFISCLK